MIIALLKLKNVKLLVLDKMPTFWMGFKAWKLYGKNINLMCVKKESCAKYLLDTLRSSDLNIFQMISAEKIEISIVRRSTWS